ncbi:hypothetical protein SAMN02745181_1783 [Rubritalea squalenifaciens DSM 18772]|uniref:Glutamyl-tRNA amidotransferase n=1 Tax=Rubritalea squalenifaciens DSM 18772 TaxID=1123071 RepID=A0A1M6IER6_9BACT|nr:GatB/YqeY domain-containing protein [Rubritalea squalenifaciens]SHJ32950.1 hypothetical protein SAMN02745181_1783 [Rubritalea squalenifaciens DSM 18772]
MSIQETLKSDMKDAMKSKDKVALTTIRSLISAIKNAAIEKGGASAELDETEAMAVVRKQIKQRQDSIKQYQDAGRPELADAEQAEVTVLEKYLPAALSDAEIEAAVTAAITETGASTRADMGKVMGVLQKSTEGRADGKTLSQAVMKALS